MSARHTNKPSIETINIFCVGIECLLSAHRIKLEVKLRDNPLKMESYRNGVLEDTVFHWIDDVIIQMPDGERVSVDFFAEGIEDAPSRESIWREAHHIQDQIYQHLGRAPQSPHSDDPYWKLWDHLKRK